MGEEEEEEVEAVVGVARRRRSRAEETKAPDGAGRSPREKAEELWGTVKQQLVEFSALPEHMRDNNYILGHYRVNYPFKRALLSVFSMHNETFNIWTYVRFPLLFASKNWFFFRKSCSFLGCEVFSATLCVRCQEHG